MLDFVLNVYRFGRDEIHLFFYKQPFYKQLAVAWQIA